MIRQFQGKSYRLKHALIKGTTTPVPLEAVMVNCWSDNGMDYRDLTPLNDLGIAITRRPVSVNTLGRGEYMALARRDMKRQSLRHRLGDKVLRVVSRG